MRQHWRNKAGWTAVATAEKVGVEMEGGGAGSVRAIRLPNNQLRG
jgi:hypothetical protein